MSGADAAVHRQQNLYWNEVVQLKGRCEYMRRYRNLLGRWMTYLAGLRAVASSGALAAWAIVQAHPLVWSSIIAAAQLADVLKDVLPLTAKHHAAADLTMNLEAILIEALFEWEGVFAGKFTDEEITERRRKLMERQHQADVKYFPKGNLSERKDLRTLANQDATAYFATMFEVGSAS